MNTQFAASRTTKILTAGTVVFLTTAVIFFVLGREAQLRKQREEQMTVETTGEGENVNIEYRPGADKNCLNTIPKVVLVKDEREVEKDIIVTSLMLTVSFKDRVSFEDKKEGILLSGFVEGKNHEWKTITLLRKQMIDTRGRDLPYVVQVPVWEFSPDSFMSQQPESVRVRYSLDILGCAEISGYTNEIKLTNISK